MRLSVRSLEAFREIIRCGSVTAAAETLELSQPSVSRLLASLERDLGFPIFHRRKGRLEPTPQAMLLYEEVDLAITSLERVNAVARDLHTPSAGHLRIVAPPSFAEGPLVPLLTSFMESHPRVNVKLDSRTRPTTLGMIAGRAADCGFGKLPITYPGIRSRPLVKSESVCAIAKGHPLLACSTVKPQDLAQDNLILIGQGGDTRVRIETAFRDAGVVPRIRLETHNVGAACAFAAQGIGVALVNELLARAYLHLGIELRIFRPRILHEYVFMTSSGVQETPVTTAFYEHCVATLALGQDDAAGDGERAEDVKAAG
jgi:DNA-binding transcriptional LysR family regulator